MRRVPRLVLEERESEGALPHFAGLRDIWAKVTVSIGYGGYANKSQVVAMIYFTRSITVQMRGSRIEGANTAYTP